MIQEPVFAGYASINGLARRVSFSNNMLTISDVGYEEAAQLVEAIEREFAESETVEDLVRDIASKLPQTEGQPPADRTNHTGRRYAADVVSSDPGVVARREPAATNGAAPHLNGKANGVVGAAKSAADIDPQVGAEAKEAAASKQAPPPKTEAAPRTRRRKADAEPESSAEAQEPAAADEEMEPNEAGVLVPKGHREKIEAVHGKGAGMPSEDDPKPAKRAGTAAPEVAAAVDDEELPAQLLGAKKMKDVLAYLMDVQNITDPDELKERVLGMKDRIEFLKNIADIPGRVERTLDVMDVGSAEN